MYFCSSRAWRPWVTSLAGVTMQNGGFSRAGPTRSPLGSAVQPAARGRGGGGGGGAAEGHGARGWRGKAVVVCPARAVLMTAMPAPVSVTADRPGACAWRETTRPAICHG